LPGGQVRDVRYHSKGATNGTFFIRIGETGDLLGYFQLNEDFMQDLLASFTFIQVRFDRDSRSSSNDGPYSTATCYQ
jgi:hypothetical protein